ncbi:MAG TPA: hypothetical protein VIU63_04450 [Nitrospira sp.]
MAQVFRSGAFLQQCWSVHPLCIAVKRLRDDRTLILSCSSCRFVHHLGLCSVSLKTSAAPAETKDAEKPADPQSSLAECLSTHAPALSLREMDVFEDVALIRCAECRRYYELQISSFETHQK